MSAPAWLQRYAARGFRLVFYDTRQKGPTGSDAIGWTDRTYPIDAYQPGQNVGILTGHEVEPGKFLVDLDFDWAEGLNLSQRLLPGTEFGFGRASRPLSHAFFTTPEPLKTRVFTGIDGKNIVEMRGTKTDGSVGLQTMAPPSIHPSGEEVILKFDGAIGHVTDLNRAVTLYAIGCLLYQHLGQRGLLHDARLALAGFLLSLGLSETETITIGEAIAEASGNNVADVSVTVRSTLTRIRNGERSHGKGQLIKVIGDDGKKVVARIREWLGDSDFLYDDKDRILANNQENIRRALEKLDIDLKFNAFTQKPIINYNGYSGTLHDNVLNKVWFDIDTNFHFRPTKEFFGDFVTDHAYRNQFHPVKDYLKSLEWDLKHRLDTWLSTYGGADDNDYTRAVGSIVLIAAVRRVMKPGCKFDEMLVLESPQGMLKSSALAALCPVEDWFSDNFSLDDDAKQIIEATAGKWIVEVAELSGMGKSSVEHLKASLSRQVDGPVRLAYARLSTEIPRQWIPIGTTNAHAYLLDATGNRRFWPVRVGRFDVDQLIQDRDQLWAEAAVRESRGESIRLHPSLYGVAALQQERRRADDPWEQNIALMFDDSETHRVSYEALWERLGMPIMARDERSQRRILMVMQKLGFRRMSVREKGKVVKGFGRDGKRPQLKLPVTDSDTVKPDPDDVQEEKGF